MKVSLVLILLAICAVRVDAQIETPVKWSYAAKRLPNYQAEIYMKATIEPGWHVYAIKQTTEVPTGTVIKFITTASYQLIGKVNEPVPITKYEDAYDSNISFFEKQVIFTQKVKLLKSEATTVKGYLKFMVCNDSKCLPTETVNFSIPIK